MRLLLIKTSSLGDVIHTFPALSDALRAYPDLRVDWVVEEAYAELAALHPAVERVIPIALRRWRRRPWALASRQAWAAYRASLREHPYDLVLDAQGLLKSAFLLRAAPPGIVRAGFDRASLREPWASWFYDRGYAVTRQAHAVERTRSLMAQALAYTLQGEGDYGLRISADASWQGAVWLLHGSSWPTKLWPLAAWRQLAQSLGAQGLTVVVPYGQADEEMRARQIAADQAHVRLWPASGVAALASALAGARAVVGVDTGLSHLAAALDRPVVALFGPTEIERTGLYGSRVVHLQAQLPCQPCRQERCRIEPQAGAAGAAPCMVAVSVTQVRSALQALL